MAIGIIKPSSNKIAASYQKIRESKRLKYCFPDSVVFNAASELKSAGRLAHWDSHSEKKEMISAQRINIVKLFISLHEKDPTFYIYQEQISEALSIDMKSLQLRMSGVRDTLLNEYFFALRNLYGVGYRIANYQDLIIEIEKSIKRIFGSDFKALKRLRTASNSRGLKQDAPKFLKTVEVMQENFLTELEDSVESYTKEDDELSRLDDEYRSFKELISAEISSMRPIA